MPTDISSFMYPTRGKPTVDGPFLMLPTGTKNRTQRVQARLGVALCTKEGVTVTLMAGDARRQVVDVALIPWSDIGFDLAENALVAGARTLTWRGRVLCTQWPELARILPDEARERFMAVPATVAPEPASEVQRREQRQLEAEKERARMQAKQERDMHVHHVLSNTMLSNRFKLHQIAHILRSEHVPARFSPTAYPGKRLPTGRSACKWPLGAFISWSGYDVFASTSIAIRVRSLCSDVEKDNEVFWAQVQKP